jgi:hypothetical protein
MKIAKTPGILFNEVLPHRKCEHFLILREHEGKAVLYTSPMDDCGWFAAQTPEGNVYWRDLEAPCCESVLKDVLQELHADFQPEGMHAKRDIGKVVPSADDRERGGV